MEQLKDIYPHQSFTIDNDLFDQGLDRYVCVFHGRQQETEIFISLSATVLRRRIFSALRSDKSSASAAEIINQNTVYAHPTVQNLSMHIAPAVKAPNGSSSESRLANDATIRIENMIKKYAQGLDGEIRGAKPLPRLHTILLTGSTGNLGSYLLESLLRDENVERVYALNRPSSQSPLEKHEERFEDRALDIKLLRQQKPRFIEGDTSSLKLGLPDDVYYEVRIF